MIVNAPSPLVSFSLTTLVSTSVAFTSAPGTTAPELSSTVPVTVPVGVWANNPVHPSSNAVTSNTTDRLLNLIQASLVQVFGSQHGSIPNAA